MSFKCPVCNAEYPQNVEKCEICGFADQRGIDRTFPVAEDAESWLNGVVKPYREKWHERIKGKGGKTVSGTAQPESAQPVPEGLKYIRAGNKEILITGYAGKAPELDIPGHIESLPVVAIGEDAFYKNKTLKKVVLPEGLKSIGRSAFEECYSLESVSLPEGLKSIGGSAFGGCDGLESVSLPASLEEIGAYCFSKFDGSKTCNIAMSRRTAAKEDSFGDEFKIYYYD